MIQPHKSVLVFHQNSRLTEERKTDNIEVTSNRVKREEQERHVKRVREKVNGV